MCLPEVTHVQIVKAMSVDAFLKVENLALAGVAQWVEHWPVN